MTNYKIIKIGRKWALYCSDGYILKERFKYREQAKRAKYRRIYRDTFKTK